MKAQRHKPFIVVLELSSVRLSELEELARERRLRELAHRAVASRFNTACAKPAIPGMQRES